ncbi:RNA recognition domain-containing protein [Colletotrichum acutatum]
MISDNDLYRLAIFLGSAAMVLIIFYHYVEVNTEEEKPEKAAPLVLVRRAAACRSAGTSTLPRLLSHFAFTRSFHPSRNLSPSQRQTSPSNIKKTPRPPNQNFSSSAASSHFCAAPVFSTSFFRPTTPCAQASTRQSLSSSQQHFVSHHALHDLIIVEEIHRPAALPSQHYRKQIFLSHTSNTTIIMSGKLDQSLDEILSTQRRSAGGPGRRSQRRSTGGRPAAAAPVGGVQKTSRPARGTAASKPNAAKPAQGSGDSKVIVSNLPKDVNEQQIKLGLAPLISMTMQYEVLSSEQSSEQRRSTGQNGFDTELHFGPIKRVDISYGPNSVSRGIANITFREADGASKAFQKLNGLLVDNRPIKIEIVVGASQAANVIPPAKKTLAERTTQPKAQPKSAANNKRNNNNNNANTGKGGAAAAGTGGKKPRAKRTGRPAKKTAEELDSEMADYFESGANPNENAAAPAPAPAATNGDAAMEDEIM